MRACVLMVVSLISIFTGYLHAATRVSKQPFGTMLDGTAVDLFTLTDGPIEVRIITYGGAVQSLKVPDRRGAASDIVLGYDTLDGYTSKQNPHFGGIIGRYANRIAKGTFQLNGRSYTIPANNGPNALHGGPRGFDQVVWRSREIRDGVELVYISPDGDQGFPGEMKAVVRYTLRGNALTIEYAAQTNKPTVVNFTNHSYFNLAGQGSDNILSHELMIAGSWFTPVDSALIPTGELRPVEGSAFDFRTPHRIGERIGADDAQLKLAGGYDHNWVRDNANDGVSRAAKVAEVYEATSGRVLEVLTTEPGVQFYTGNFLDGTMTGKDGKVYRQRYGLCLETQHFPDSPNHPNFPSTELKPGHRYHSTTVYRFSVR